MGDVFGALPTRLQLHQQDKEDPCEAAGAAARDSISRGAHRFPVSPEPRGQRGARRHWGDASCMGRFSVCSPDAWELRACSEIRQRNSGDITLILDSYCVETSVAVLTRIDLARARCAMSVEHACGPAFALLRDAHR